MTSPGDPGSASPNSSGVSVSLKPTVLVLDGLAGVAQLGASSFTVIPPRADLVVGTPFVLDDVAYVVTSSTVSSGVQSLSTRAAQQSEVISKMTVSGDLDASEIDPAHVVIRLPDGSAGGTSSSDRRHAQAAGATLPSAKCKSITVQKASNTFDASCDAQFTVYSGKVAISLSLDWKNVAVHGVKWSSASASEIVAHLDGDATLSLGAGLQGVSEAIDENEQVLVRAEIPYPGTLGFLSIRLPLMVRYKLPLPPLKMQASGTLSFVDGVPAPPVGALTYLLGDVTTTGDIKVNVSGFSHLVGGVELAVTSIPSTSLLDVLPDGASDIATAGAYLEVGPTFSMDGTVAVLGAVNCWKPSFTLDYFTNISASANIFGFVASASNQQLVKSDPYLNLSPLGNCVAAIAFDQSQVSTLVGNPIQVAPLLHASQPDGSPIDVPAGTILEIASGPAGGQVDQTGAFSAPVAGTYTIVATTASGLTSKPLTVIVGSSHRYAAYLIFQNLRCATTDTAALSISGNGQSLELDRVFTASGCMDSGGIYNFEYGPIPIDLVAGAAYDVRFAFTRGGLPQDICVTNVVYEIDAFDASGAPLPPTMSAFDSSCYPTLDGTYTATFVAK